MGKKYFRKGVLLYMCLFIVLPAFSINGINEEAKIENTFKLLEDENGNSNTRYSAVVGLQNLVEKGVSSDGKNKIIFVLRKHLNDNDMNIRWVTANALIDIDPNNKKDSISVFIGLLDTDWSIPAGGELGRIGFEAKDAVPALIEKFKHANVLNKPIYRRALEKIGTPEAMEVIKSYGWIMKINRIFLSPIANFLVALCFIGLFWWSCVLRRKGKKVFHWFFIIPIPWYIYKTGDEIWTTANIRLDAVLNYPIFIILVLIGLIPWLISWLVIWWREKSKKNIDM